MQIRGGLARLAASLSGGAPSPRRPLFNFEHSGPVALTVVDNPGQNRTDITVSSSAMVSPMTAAGDLIIGGAAGSPERLGAGAGDTVMVVDPVTGLPSWSRRVVLTYDDTSSGDSALHAVAVKTGLVAETSEAAIFVEASQAADVDDALHDFNVGLLAFNWTANGAAVVIGNWAKGDGLFAQSSTKAPSPTGSGIGNAVNVFAGSAVGAGYTGTGINVQRFSSGPALQIVGVAGSGGAGAPQTPTLINVSNESTDTTVSVTADASTTLASLIWTLTAKTTGAFVNLFQSGTAWSGNVLQVNVGNGGGAFTGLFEQYQVGGSTVFQVNHAGTVTALGGVIAQGGTNALTIAGGGAGSPVTLTASGGDANIAIALAPKGGGAVQVIPGGAGGSAIAVLYPAPSTAPCMFLSNVQISTVASAGTNGATPLQVAEYLVIEVNGNIRKIPLYPT